MAKHIKINDEWHAMDETPGLTKPIDESPFRRTGRDHQMKASKCGLWGLSMIVDEPLPGERVCEKCYGEVSDHVAADPAEEKKSAKKPSAKKSAEE
jgi:hypothetical protein